MKNPTYFIGPNDQDIDVRLILRPTDPVAQGEDFPSVCICIYEIGPNNTYQIFLEDDSYAGRPWGYYSPIFTLPANYFGYLAVCVNFDRGALGNFEFEI